MPRSTLIALFAVLASQAAAAESLHRYTIWLDDGLQQLRVRACFAGGPPPRLEASDDAWRDLLDVRSSDGEPLSTTRAGIDLRGLAADSCIAYRVDLEAATARSSLKRYLPRGEDRLTRPGSWLWRPPRLGPGEDVELTFELPDGVSVSAPWRFVERKGSRAVYRLGRSPAYWPALVAFGRFEVEELGVPGARLRLAILDGEPAPDRAALAAWIAEAARAVTTLYGRFPVESPQILVVPYGEGKGPVPWGQVQRGGGPAVHLLVNQREPLRAFREDWTATHELSHLLLPYLGSRNAWLSEGIASYYQNVLRARAAMLSEHEAWQKLHEGFERGRRDQRARGLTLRQASAEMHRRGAYMRVYWSGAAYALLADVQLRSETGGRESMDTALERLQQCCLPADGTWTARQLIERLDALSASRVFSRLYAEMIDSRQFPQTTDLYAELGLAARGRRIELAADAPLADIRATIMNGTASGQTVAIGR